MALPVTISGATFTRKNCFVGPFKSSGASFYVVAIDTTSNKYAVYKATDPTSSFSEQDSANRPTAAVGAHPGAWAVQDGDILRMLTPDGNSRNTFYHDFSMATDTWGTKDVTAVSESTGIIPNIGCSLVKRSAGDLVGLVYVNETIKGAAWVRTYYVLSTDGGATWSAPTAVGATGVERHVIGNIAILGASDRSHFFYTDDTTLKHRSLSSANSLGSEETPTSANAVTAQLHNVISGVSYVSGANTVIKTAYRASGSDKLDSIEFNSAATGATVGTAAFIDNTIFDDGVTTSPRSVHGCMAKDGTTVHCLYADHTTQDLFHDKQTDGGSWGTDVEELDAVTVNAVSCNIYDRSGIRLAYVYDDGGTVKYNEINLSSDQSWALSGVLATG